MLFEYFLFLAKVTTLLIAFLIIIGTVFLLRRKNSVPNFNSTQIRIQNLNKKYETLKKRFLNQVLSEDELKEQEKKEKQENKKHKEKEDKPILYVLSFKGSPDAKEVEFLRDEISAIISIIRPKDQVVLRLESPGGTVPGYGLAASQLLRLRSRGIYLTIVVDKIAASGGYMMACVGERIIAAPFAIVGSIGVVAQVPNIHRLLKKNDVDVDVYTAGKYKRTVTMLGENTDEGKEKFKHELEETHILFKEFVTKNRNITDPEQIFTGEHWYGTQAEKLGLIDEIGTSDDYIFAHLETHKILAVSTKKKQSKFEALSKNLIQNVYTKLFN